MDRRATTAAGFFEVLVFELELAAIFEPVDAGRRVSVDAAPVRAVLAWEPWADFRETEAFDADFDVEWWDAGFLEAEWEATAPDAVCEMDAVWLAGLCVDLWCDADFAADCADEAARVLAGAFCAARLPAAKRLATIARFETRKRTV